MSDEIVAAQRAYYDERAPDYLVKSKPSDRAVRGWVPSALRIQLTDAFAPSGDVLELACGTGTSTQDLVRHARTLTCVDGSPRMIERNRAEVNDASITYVLADIFEWEPDRTYDTVFFAFWLSHVPDDRFDAFWDLVRRCLAPGGRVGFMDEDDRGGLHEPTALKDGVRVAQRTLADGRTFDIVKVYWRPDELEARLRALGWDVDVHPFGETFLFGSGGLNRT
jgi:demethylmenaquinone methyltransferase/2-methoxy-6-polyprenyl-1,4-benzoquinol methylase